MRQGLKDVFPAAVLLIARHGEIVFHRAYGWLDPDTCQLPTRLDTLFDLASLTKLFTATAFMTLVEAKQVALDTPVGEVIPEFGGVRPIVASADPQTKAMLPPDPAFAGQMVDADAVTFRHLLTHTSGLAAWRDLCQIEAAPKQPQPHKVQAETRTKRLADLYERPIFTYPPGERIVYSDQGFILLGEAVARLSGMALDASLDQSLFSPLALPHATFNPRVRGIPTSSIAPTEFCPWRQRRLWGEVHDENAACLGGVAGHAGLFATASDVAALGQLFLAAGRYGGAHLLSPQTVAAMTRKQVGFSDDVRGLGWMLESAHTTAIRRSLGSNSYGHTGFTGTSLWVAPDRQPIIALLTNRVYNGRENAGIIDLRVRVHQIIADI